jgi:hypothetical protein
MAQQLFRPKIFFREKNFFSGKKFFRQLSLARKSIVYEAGFDTRATNRFPFFLGDVNDLSGPGVS